MEKTGLPFSPIQDFIFVTIPVQYEMLLKIAAQNQVSVSEFVSNAVDYYVEYLNSANPDSHARRTK